jgi:TetR/AcrR family transcriptional regulator, fatty acid metabolism regulator protein
MRSGNRSPNQDSAPATSRSFIEEARRRQIIDAAIETIAELGYAHASFAKIAERAGISPSLISYHFASKAALLTAVNEAVVGDMDRALTGATDGSRSYVDAIGRLVAEFVRFTATHRSQMYALREISMGSASDGMPAPGHPAASGTAEMAEMLSEGQEAGEFRAFHVPTMATTVLAILHSVPVRLYNDPGADIDLIAAELATTVELAVAKKRRRTIR